MILVGYGLASYPLEAKSHVVFTFYKHDTEWIVCYGRGKTIGNYQREAQAFKLGSEMPYDIVENLIIQRFDGRLNYAEFKKRTWSYIKECHGDIQIQWHEELGL